MTFHVLLSDDVHLHPRNFASLFDLLNTTATIKYSTLQQGRTLWNRYGEYVGVPEIEDIAEHLRSLDESRLRELTCKIGSGSTNAFEIARAEILSFVTTRDKGWYRNPIPNNDDIIFSKLYSQNNSLLRLNLAAVLHWCSIYATEIRRYPRAKVCVVFSGSQIYQRLLLEHCKSSNSRAIVVESFQTGDDFYFEERYTPISAGSDIRYSTVFNSLALPADPLERQNERNIALNKLLNGQNKNVTQPDEAVLPDFKGSAPCILVSAQVQNDFSILESKLEDVNAIANYKRIVEGIISTTDFNVIIKTHPWERRKTHLGRPFTYEELTTYFNDLQPEERSRIHICENENLRKLLNRCDAFVTLTSQSAIEACLYGGLRPFTAGHPFYSAKGFSNDYQNVGDLIAALRDDRSKWCLELSEYESFVDFVTRLLQVQLASIHRSGVRLIRDRIIGHEFVEVGKMSLSRDSKQTTSVAVKKPQSMVKPPPITMSSSEDPPDSTDDKAYQNIAPYRRPLVPIVRPFVARIGNKKDVRDFDSDPAEFFAKLRNPWYRGVGAILFPPRR
ncbi:hypothetical protein [Rhizobium sp. YS-1r]|uniref:capsular polysaccharide export protein, LipB/KpsS family n=1 Tax=Rhizobium sp. YS-1r TaxID=1532558 RepID=UPI0013773102|nr:hypothetical protein [Rhizobium sp. YS-1r]